MKATAILGVILIVLGILALAYKGIPTRTERDVVRVGPMETTIETRKVIEVPPLVAGLGIAGGVVLVVVGLRKKS
ncbi:MAG TPA: hypothetical protein VKE24_04555 [Candidatus Acidoferrales bacterium]|nr:hypothetical protein [Candidatus Acidoferrales bacterium]